MSFIEDEYIAFDHRLCQDIHSSDCISEAVQRAQDDHIQVQIDPAFLVQDCDTERIAQVL